MLPLEGVKVLDLSRLLPGPYCSMILGDMGAEIIRVEEPEGVQGRRGEAVGVSPRPTLSPEERLRRRAFDAAGRNKRSIILNLKTPQGQQVLYKLARWADVFVEEFRPGVARRLGLDYETLKGINPGLVYCSISLYGQDGPYRTIPGHDACSQAIAGILDSRRDREGRPMFPSIPMVDITTGLHAVIGILLALRAREKMGRGQHVDISMTDSALDFMLGYFIAFFRDNRVMDKQGWSGVYNGVFPTQEGKYICITNEEAHHWANFCRAVGREDLIPYHRAQGEEAREVYSQLHQLTQTRTREEWFRLAQEVDTQIAPVLEIQETVADPQVRHRHMVLELEHPTLGKVKQLGIAIKLGETPGRVRSLAPLPGQHAQEILTQLGYSPEEIETLRQQGVLG